MPKEVFSDDGWWVCLEFVISVLHTKALDHACVLPMVWGTVFFILCD